MLNFNVDNFLIAVEEFVKDAKKIRRKGSFWNYHCEYVSRAARCPLARVFNILYFVAWPSRAWGLWVCLGSHHLFPALEVHGDMWHLMMRSLHHRCTSSELRTLYKRQATIIWGSFSWNTVRQGSGIGLGSRVTPTPRLGSEHCSTLLFGSPSPWQLWFIHCVLSIVFLCFL